MIEKNGERVREIHASNMIYIYIYIYIYMNIYTNFIKHNRHFLIYIFSLWIRFSIPVLLLSVYGQGIDLCIVHIM